jgi:hypothetical protein
MFRAKRKGVELSINAIIIMVLALLILAIGAFLIIRGAGSLNDITNCEKQGGHCQKACDDTNPVPSANYCSDKTLKCCTKLEGIA